MARGGGGLEAYGALILRVTLGVVFVMRAYRLLFVWGPGDVLAFQNAYGLPLPIVTYWYVLIAQGAGGLFLILGVLVRWVALLNLPALVVAFVVVHARGSGFIEPPGGYEVAVLAFMATLALACLGPGAFTLRR